MAGTIRPEGRLELMQFRRVEVSDSVSIGVEESAQAMKSADGSLIGVRVADSNRTSSGTDLDAERATLLYSIEGLSRQNEQGVERVSALLVERLNLDGAKWGPPVVKKLNEFEQGIDATAIDGTRFLRMQVTRAEPSGEVWSRLRANGMTRGALSVEEAAAILRWAIERKASKAPTSQRAELVLVLDALDTASFALDAVVEAFRHKFGSWARSLGYESIWVVGPNVRLTARLDVSPQADPLPNTGMQPTPGSES
jgi:hypothetical protein